MARTKQTARKGGEEVVDNPDLTQKQVEKLKELEDAPMQAELKYIDKKWTEQGQIFYSETVEQEIPDQINWWSQFALCLVRHMGDHTNKWVQRTCLQVNSQHLKDILKETIGNFPGVSIASKDVAIDKPYRCLYHYRHELQAAGDGLEEGSEAAGHHGLLMNFINEEFKEAIAESENLLEQGMMSYDLLWTIFRPGTTVYGPVFGQPRAFELLSYQYSYDIQRPGLVVSVSFTDFDGEDMGTRNTTRLVPEFSGAAKICALSTFPIEFHPDPTAAKKQLITRGRRWEAHAGIHFCNYHGIGLEHKECKVTRYHVGGRVVVDTKTFNRLCADEAWFVNPFQTRDGKHAQDDEEDPTDELHLVPQETLNVAPLTDEQCMLANAMVRGFSFDEKRWLDFFIDKLSPVEWNPNCFNQLVLPDAQKELVKALVATHVDKRHEFDDIIKGKGKGLIFVLHGPPGVGKTLTAETVAEFSQRPLYMVSSGDLGTQSCSLDERLSRILDMASTWKAVLLIDEADIFLERRSLHDLERNSLVSIFLRVLEYYEGILFLTSNRVATFDEAFKSRIHVPLKYNDLTIDSRKQIWKNFLQKLQDGSEEGPTATGIDDEGYAKLATAEINGRQIKNVIRTAKSLAQFHGQKLDLEKLQQVIGIQEEFEHELDLTNVVHVVN